MKTYNVFFNDDNDSNDMGWHATLDDCKHYIKTYNGRKEGYFEDYKNGVVSIVCNETEETVCEEAII